VRQGVPFEVDASASTDGPGGGGITGYDFEFDDGTTEHTDQPQATHTYHQADGPYSVTVTVTNKKGRSSKSDPAIIEVIAEQPPVPVDCVLSDWSEWSEWVDNGDGTETRSRIRTIVVEPANGGQPCEHQEETERRYIALPVDCVLGPEFITAETPLEACQPDGFQAVEVAWSKTILTPPANGGQACGATSGTRIEKRACVYVPATDDHARFDTLRALPQCLVSESLRVQSEIDALTGAGVSTAYVAKQDEAELIIPPDRASLAGNQQLIIPIRQTTGPLLLTWDVWYGHEWRKVEHGGSYDYAFDKSYQHKEFQCGFDTDGGGGKGTIFFETQTMYQRGTADHVGAVGHRLYGVKAPGTTIEAGEPNAHGSPYGPGTEPDGVAMIQHSTYCRHVLEIRPNQPASAFPEWEALTGVTLPPDEVYHMYSSWFLTPTQTYRLLFRIPAGRYKGATPEILRDGLSAFWFEHNTSSKVGVMTGPGTIRSRDFVCLKGYVLPDVPEDDALIFERPS